MWSVIKDNAGNIHAAQGDWNNAVSADCIVSGLSQEEAEARAEALRQDARTRSP